MKYRPLQAGKLLSPRLGILEQVRALKFRALILVRVGFDTQLLLNQEPFIPSPLPPASLFDSRGEPVPSFMAAFSFFTAHCVSRAENP